MQKIKVAVISNVSPTEDDEFAELDSNETVKDYCDALISGGYLVEFHEGNEHLPDWLRKYNPDICFNTCEGIRGDSRESHVPALLEMMGIHYTGPGPLSAAITLDKRMAKIVFEKYGVLTPKFQVFTDKNESLSSDLKYPLFVKPLHEGTGMGIRNDSIVQNYAELSSRVGDTIEKYKQPALVEEYIEGKDITCGLIGNQPDIHMFPISEIDLSGYDPGFEKVYGIEQKIKYANQYKNKIPAPLASDLVQHVINTTLKIFEITFGRDYARVDYRLTPDNKLYAIEINSLPGVTKISDLSLMAYADKWTYEDIICSIVKAGLKRIGKITC